MNTLLLIHVYWSSVSNNWVKIIAVGNPGGGPLTTQQFNIKARKQKKETKMKGFAKSYKINQCMT